MCGFNDPIMVACLEHPMQVSTFNNPLPNNKFLYSPKLKEFIDDNFKLNENGKKFSIGVKVTV